MLWLTFSLRDRAADGGAGGSDGAHGRAHAVRRVYPGHGRCVGHPRGWVNGPDWLTCWINERARSYSWWSHQSSTPKEMALHVWMLLQWKREKGNKRKKHLLLGRAKQLRGFGSQHLATVRVMGLVTKRQRIDSTYLLLRFTHLLVFCFSFIQDYFSALLLKVQYVAIGPTKKGATYQ